MLDGTPVGINQVERHAAELRTLATVGRPPEAILRGIALSAIADAEGTVDEDLQLYIRHGLVDGANLVDRQFAGKHDPPESQLLQPAHLLGRAVVGLRRSVEG